ncbi:MAG: hypothetical protein AB7F89_26145 [Pirellulaceae bacterium]
MRAIAFRPSAPRVVHHSLFFVETGGRARALDAADPLPGFQGGMGALWQLGGSGLGPFRFLAGPPTPSGTPAPDEDSVAAREDGADLPASVRSLGGWAVGAQPFQLPPGLAFHLPAGAEVILSTHFHPSGKVEQEASTLGLYFADAPPRQHFMPVQLPPAFGAFAGIDIPAGAKDYAIEDAFTLPVDVRAFAVGAHAHYLGKSLTMTATLPDGSVKTILSIPDWDFAWQERYEFAQFVELPKNTRLRAKITYDNSADNPRNPVLPPRRVRFGEQSTDEMGSVTLFLVAAEETELPRLQQAYRDHFRRALLSYPLLRMIESRLRRG